MPWTIFQSRMQALIRFDDHEYWEQMKYLLSYYRPGIIITGSVAFPVLPLALSSEIGYVIPVICFLVLVSLGLIYCHWVSKKFIVNWLDMALEDIKIGKVDHCLQCLILTSRYVKTIDEDVRLLCDGKAELTPIEVLRIINKALGVNIAPEQVDL